MPLTSIGSVDLDLGLCQYVYSDPVGGEVDTEFALNASTSVAGIDLSCFNVC